MMAIFCNIWFEVITLKYDFNLVHGFGACPKGLDGPFEAMIYLFGETRLCKTRFETQVKLV